MDLLVLSNGTETCGNTTAADLAACYGHGECVFADWGFRHLGTWYCQCSRFWDARTSCQRNYFDEIGDVFLIAPVVTILVATLVGLWMLIEIGADFFQNKKRVNLRTPAFAAKLMLVATVICFVLSSSVLVQSVRARDVIEPVVLVTFDSLGVYGLAATSCLLVTLWLSMIVRVKHLDSRSAEGRLLARLSIGIYVVVSLAACAYIAMSILLGLNIMPLLQAYTQVTVQLVYVIAVVVTTSVHLRRLTAWIAAEATVNSRLRRLQRKNNFIIANNVLIVLGFGAFMATNLTLERPSLYLVTFTVLRLVYMAQLTVLAFFLENHLTHGGYARAFRGLRSHSHSGGAAGTTPTDADKTPSATTTTATTTISIKA